MNTEHLSNVTESLLAEEVHSSPFSPDNETGFPLDALPKTLHDIATEVSWAYKAPMDLVAPQTLAVYSACLGKGVNLETNHPDQTYGLLYMFLGTKPGICKSSVLKYLAEPLKDHQKKIRLDYRTAIQIQLTQDLEEKKNKPMPKDWQPSQKDIDDEIGKTMPTLIAEHYSQEGLATTLSYNDEYAFLMSTDASGVVDMLRGSKSGGHHQGEILLKGYGGESYDCNNKVAMDEHLDEIRLTINWLGTLDTLKTFITDPQIKGRGLLSRFLFAEIDEPIPLADVHRRKVATGASENWHELLTSSLTKYWRSKSVETVKMSVEAIQMSVDFRNEYVKAQDDLFGLSSLPERWAENALRIALVIHVCKYKNKPSGHVLDETTMGEAIRIMWWFIGREMACLDSFKDYDPIINDKKVKVLNILKDNGPCTMRDFYKKAGLKKKDTAMVKKWARDGELVMWDASQGNKPSPTFALVGDDRIPEGVKLITK